MNNPESPKPAKDDAKKVDILEILERCEAKDNFSELTRYIRQGMERACGLGNPLPETVQEIADKNATIEYLALLGKLDEALPIAERLVTITRYEYGDHSEPFGKQCKIWANLLLESGETEKGNKFLSLAYFTLENCAYADDNWDLEAYYIAKLEALRSSQPETTSEE